MKCVAVEVTQNHWQVKTDRYKVESCRSGLRVQLDEISLFINEDAIEIWAPTPETGYYTVECQKVISLREFKRKGKTNEDREVVIIRSKTGETMFIGEAYRELPDYVRRKARELAESHTSTNTSLGGDIGET